MARKKVAKKKTAKKKVVRKKVAVNAKSRATKKAPTAKLKSRRKANTKKGYYPNPVMDLYVIKIRKGNKTYYFNGAIGDSVRANAAHYRNIATAKKIAQKVADNVGLSAIVTVDDFKAKKK